MHGHIREKHREEMMEYAEVADARAAEARAENGCRAEEIAEDLMVLLSSRHAMRVRI